MVKLSAIQLCSVPDVAENLAQIDAQIALLPTAEQHIVVLPECCLFFGGRDAQQLQLAQQTYQNQYLVEELAALAKKHQVILVAGSIPMLHSIEQQELAEQKFTNSSLVFSAQGKLLKRYDKIHLFDVEVNDNEKSYRESKFTWPGKKIATLDLSPVILGLSICYDLRFPELYRQLSTQGANVITVPAAFTRVTGQAHWETLIRARAIENQAYVIAAGQEGIHANGRETWGHSMIVSPWGEILAQQATGVGSISVDFEISALEHVKQTMPVGEHNQFTTKFKSYE
ncbi:carbon-nitrogen hydrolase family protein [Thalassotalea fusca]